MGVVHDPVEDRVGDGGFPDHGVPPGHGKLGGDDGGSALVAFFEELQQVEALLVAQPVRAPVIEDQQLDAGELIDQTGKPAVQAGHGHVLEQPGHADIGDGVIKARGLVREGTGQPCLSGAGLAGENDLFVGLDPVALGERQDLAPVEAAAGAEVDIFDAGIGEAHLGVSQPVGKALVGPIGGLAVEHEPECRVAL